MRVINRFEVNLLRVLHAVMSEPAAGQLAGLLVQTCERPPCLGRGAVDLVQQTLARGSMLLLARRGGWRRQRFLRHNEPREGRLWERTLAAELGLTFSRQTLDFLCWATALDMSHPDGSWRSSRSEEPTLGDQWLWYLAFRAVQGTRVETAWSALPEFRRHPLCVLAYPDRFVQADLPDELDFSPWVTGPGACILEAWQDELVRCMVAVERRKGQIEKPTRMQRIGEIQERVLGAFLDALDRAGRRDLGRFLLAAAETLLAPGISAEAWIAALAVRDLRLADRQQVYRTAFALLHQLERLEKWQRQAIDIGYFDEGYAASQLWKSDWEQLHGQRSYETAIRLMRQPEPGLQAGQTGHAAADETVG